MCLKISLKNLICLTNRVLIIQWVKIQNICLFLIYNIQVV